jgi:hypothetical protein
LCFRCYAVVADPFIAEDTKVVATATGSVIATTISPAWASAIASRLSGQKGALLRLVATANGQATRAQIDREIADLCLAGLRYTGAGQPQFDRAIAEQILNLAKNRR